MSDSVWACGALSEKLKEDGVVGCVAVVLVVLELDGGAGWEKVNCTGLVEPPLLPAGNGLFAVELEGAATGIENLNPGIPKPLLVGQEELI